MSLHHVLEHFSYLAVFLGTFIEGETVGILAGFAARSGNLKIFWVSMVVTLAAFVSDQLYFSIGNRYGARILKRKPRWAKRSARIRLYISERGNLFLFSFRFMYGIRIIAPFMIGMSDVKPLRFGLINAISAIVWGVSFSMLGFGLGAAAEKLIGHIKHYELYFFVGIAIVGAIIWIVRHLLSSHGDTSKSAPTPAQENKNDDPTADKKV